LPDSHVVQMHPAVRANITTDIDAKDMRELRPDILKQ